MSVIIVKILFIEFHLKDNISRTGFDLGMDMKSEFVKNSNLRLASRFLGTFTAESLIVKSECSLRICDLFLDN